MPKQDIQTIADVQLLVETFYSKIKTHDDLAVFFSGITNWNHHINQISLFWHNTLFITQKNKIPYKGNPLIAHINLDKHFKNTLKPKHFGLWLNTWFATIDALFEGEVANRAKHRAQKISSFLYLKIFESRENKID